MDQHVSSILLKLCQEELRQFSGLGGPTWHLQGISDKVAGERTFKEVSDGTPGINGKSSILLNYWWVEWNGLQLKILKYKDWLLFFEMVKLNFSNLLFLIASCYPHLKND